MTHCLFVERLTNLDFTYFDWQRGLVGETLWLDVKLHGNLNQDQMIWDFAEVKHQLKEAVEACIDHKLVLPAKADYLKINSVASGNLDCELRDSRNRLYRYLAPAVAVCLCEAKEITLLNLQNHVLSALQHHPILAPLLAHLTCELTLYADPQPEFSSFHYSHGLRQHQGACQRIVHGHRSLLKIFFDQQRVPSLERLWIHRWQDIYLGCQQDWQRSFSENGITYDEFAYHSPEGFYQVQLPAANVYRLPASSTIECIAEHLAIHIHNEFPNQNLQVQVYEGVHKGALFNLTAVEPDVSSRDQYAHYYAPAII